MASLGGIIVCEHIDNDGYSSINEATLFVDVTCETNSNARALAIVSLYCDSKEISSKDGKNVGNAIPNNKKLSLCRAEWKKQAIASNLLTARSKAAYAWLVVNNPTYARYISRHTEILASEAKNRFYFTTANLLLHEHGIEVAMRPCLYPREAFGDSDVTERLLRLGRMTDMRKS